MNKNEKAIAYFMSIQGRSAGKLLVVRYIKLLNTGRLIVVDATRGKIASLYGFGSKPINISRSDKRTWERHYNKVKSSFQWKTIN